MFVQNVEFIFCKKDSANVMISLLSNQEKQLLIDGMRSREGKENPVQ